MRPKNAFLERPVVFLEVKGDPLEPEQKSMPVDQGDDLQGHEGILDREREESGGGQFRAPSGQRTGQGAICALIVVDADDEPIAGTVKTEIKFEIEG